MTASDTSNRRELCPVCGARPRALDVGTYCDNALCCRRCGHTFVATLPTAAELARIYDRYGYDRLDEEPPPAFLDLILVDLMRSFEPYRQTQRFLDVGFGAGGLLRVAKSQGWKTYGVETSPWAVEVGNRRALGELVRGDFLVAPLPAASFDVVVMTELIEHLLDPLPFLRRAAELLRPGGLLYVTTPHGRGVSGRVLGASWSILRPPEHLQLFSIRSARRSVKEAGFREARVYTQGLLPHELVGALRRRLVDRGDAVRPAPAAPDRVAKGYQLNETLTRSVGGRAFKRMANVALGATRLGDSLRIEAIR
jgi:2-polyprenyl-3-methyl-5-hydroxy-6-metoxy-1,4-benzoquinol methylase